MPGRPITRIAPSRPCIIGLPGRIAICQNAMVTPSASSDCLTRSWSPTEAPPVVTRISAPQSRARRMPSRGGLDGIGGDAEIDGLGAFVAGQRPQRVAVGIDDLSGAGGRARHHQFVAGGEHRDLRPAAHGKLGIVHARGQREIAVGEADSLRQQHIALAKVDAGGADMPSRARGLGDGDAAAFGDGVFLDDDGVGAFGDHAAGKDPHGFARAKRLVERAAGRDLADHLEPGPGGDASAERTA